MYLFESLNLLIQRYLPEEQIKRLKQAYLVARDAHEGQTRSSGEPYITHPVAVACILAEMRLDHETLMAALLHDVIEDTPATYQDMEQLFGKSVAELVEGVSKLDKLKFQDKKEAQAENFRKMIMAIVQDISVAQSLSVQAGKDDYYPGLYGSQLQVNCLKADLPEVPVYGMRFYLDEKMYEVESVGDDMGILTIQLVANDR